MADQNHNVNVNVRAPGADETTKKIKELQAEINKIEAPKKMKDLEDKLRGLQGGTDGAKTGFAGLKDKVSEFANGALDGATSGLGKFGSLLSTGAGLAVGMSTALIGAAYAASEFGDRMALAADDAGELADKMGVTVARLELLTIAANENSGSVEGYTKVLDKLAKTTSKLDEDNLKSAQGLAKLGLTFKDIQDLAPEKQAALIVKQYELLGRSSEATAGIAQTLGPAFRDQIPMIKAVGENIGELMERQKRYAREAPAELAKAGSELEKANTNLASSWKSLGNEVATYTAGMQTAVKSWAANLLADLTDIIQKMREAKNEQRRLTMQDTDANKKRREEIGFEELEKQQKEMGGRGAGEMDRAELQRRIQVRITEELRAQGQEQFKNAENAYRASENAGKQVVAAEAKVKADEEARKNGIKAASEAESARKKAIADAERERDAITKLGQTATKNSEYQVFMLEKRSELEQVQWKIANTELGKISKLEQDRLLTNAKIVDETKLAADWMKQQRADTEKLLDLEQKRAQALNDAADAANRKLKDQGVKEQDKFSFDLRTQGMSPLEKERTAALDGVNRDFKDGKQAIFDAATNGRDPDDGSNTDELIRKIDELKAKQLEATTVINGTFDARIAKQKDWLGGLQTGAKSYFDSIADINKQMEGFGQRTFEKMGNALADFVMTGKLNFKDFARSVLADLTQIIIKQMLLNSLKGTAFGGWLGIAAADGAVISGGSVMKYAKGGVVNSTTAFPMSGGKTGVMGEAGPEAIMPLKRGADGKLGVQVSGGGGNSGINIGSISINIKGGETNEQTAGVMKKELLATMKEVAKGEIAEGLRSGGMIRSAM